MQKLAMFLACSGVLATVALSAPGPALATSPPYGNDFPVIVPPLKPGEINSSEPYEKISDGNVQLTPSGGNAVNDRLCMQLYDFYKKTPFADEKYVGNNPITLAAPAEVPRGAKFFRQTRNCGDSTTGLFKALQTH